MNKSIKTFYDLNVWQEGRKLANFTYEITKHFPREEVFGLTSQMRRASVSIVANIAEGFGRLSVREKIQFYNQANGSLTELQSHCYIANDLKYTSESNHLKMLQIAQSTQGLLQGLLRVTRNRLN